MAPFRQSSQALSSDGSWLTPPRDGTKTIPLGVIVASDRASWPAPEGSWSVVRPRSAAARLECVAHALGRGRRLAAADRLDRHPEPVRLPRRQRPRAERALERLELPPVERAALETQRGTTGNDVERAGLDRDVTDRGDAAGIVAGHDLPDLEHEGRRPDCGIAAGVHRRRPRMARLALEDDGEGGRAGDPGDDPDLRTRPLEHRALLDVKLQVAGERGGARGGRRGRRPP